MKTVLEQKTFNDRNVHGQDSSISSVIVIKRRYHPISRFIIKIEACMFVYSDQTNYCQGNSISKNKTVQMFFVFEYCVMIKKTTEYKPHSGNKYFIETTKSTLLTEVINIHES